MICQDCGVESPTKFVAFYQNIGALIIRFPSSIEGYLCKSCIHRHFWTMTGITLVLGWWGTISFIVTPFFLLNNIGRYLFCLGMPAASDGAKSPKLTHEAVERIEPYAEQLFKRLKRGEDLETVAASIAKSAGVTPGQVIRFIQAVAKSQ